MHRIAMLMSAVFLAACSTGELRLVPAEEWRGLTPDEAAGAAAFRTVSREVGQEARTQCKRSASAENCDFGIFVDLNPSAPPNAFQTLDDQKRPAIIFTRSMIESTRNTDELAFVMGHEAAHHVLNHIVRQSKNASIGAAKFGEAERIRGKGDAAVERAQKLGAKVGVQAYVQDFELEADQLGTIITFNAGYNPLVGAKYFDRIPDPGDSFLGTHPPNAERVQIVLETSRKLGLSP